MTLKDPTFLLRSCKMFTELSPTEMKEVRTLTSVRTLRKGEILFHQEQPSHGFFVVASGVVKVFRVASDGREQIMHFVDAGDSFAEAAVFSATYPASAEAMADCVLLCVDKKGFKQLIARNSQLSFKIIGALEKWLRRMRERVSELSVSELPARFACYVLSLPVSAATTSGRNGVFSMTISKTALAQMLGTTKETLSRILRKFRDKRVVDYTGRRLVILNRQRLEKVARGELVLK